MKQVIHIFGASGAGTSTLGKKICDELGYFFMDTDDYFWEPTDPNYTVKRSFEERLRLMKEDIEKHDQIVISGSLVDWGDDPVGDRHGCQNRETSQKREGGIRRPAPSGRGHVSEPPGISRVGSKLRYGRCEYALESEA